MMKLDDEHYEKLYYESIQLIDNNPNITTNAIPNHLLNVWLYNGLIAPNPPFELLFAAAIYKYANNKYGNPNLDAGADKDRFNRFQQALATEYVCRRVGAKLRPRKIFDFERDLEPLNIDLKRHQYKKYQTIAKSIIPLRTGVN